MVDISVDSIGVKGGSATRRSTITIMAGTPLYTIGEKLHSGLDWLDLTMASL
jgi:hypothetical protein